MNVLTSRRYQGYTGLREVCYRDSEDLDLEFELNELYDVVTVSDEHFCGHHHSYAYHAYDLVSDEIDAKRISYASGYPEFKPFWVRDNRYA